MINKMSEKLTYRKYQKEFVFNNLLYTHFRSKFYRRKIMRIEELQKNKKSLYEFILTKKSFIIEELKLIELIISFIFSNGISFRF